VLKLQIAKVAIKDKNMVPYCGILHVMNEFNVLASRSWTSTSANVGHSFRIARCHFALHPVSADAVQVALARGIPPLTPIYFSKLYFIVL
jgi:hypothetical protein